jgi:hypothetical protein
VVLTSKASFGCGRSTAQFTVASVPLVTCRSIAFPPGFYIELLGTC